jgi:hypothetical protein
MFYLPVEGTLGLVFPFGATVFCFLLGKSVIACVMALAIVLEVEDEGLVKNFVGKLCSRGTSNRDFFV